ncbi:leucine-rich repeat domain, L domain-like protein [Artemisia annua]|uniref:Leucine-rich repeat domain, L domain-like protein n=1 Tax=Artemisia annua TaxID=35608 RepID=A0A2U1PB35_ARTAN|nr:leucine-rich repeat domain, L domain-like protein [Artemisia annua]
MAIKRIRPQEPITFIVNKKIRHTYETETDTKLEDRLTSLPESLQLHILSNLDAQYAVQTSVLSKSLVSLWKSIPILTLSSYSFKKLNTFDRFVKKVVCQSVNVDTLIFKRGETSSKKILEKVISHACSSNVKHLDLWIKRAKLGTWPVPLHFYPDSLKSLKLQSEADVLCSYLGSQAILFKNLTELYLQNATIRDLDPFSGFRVLNKLTLSGCKVDTCGNTLNIHSKHISELIILGAYCGKYINCIELMTPKLRMFEYEGFDHFPMLKTCDGLPNLDSMVIGSREVHCVDNEKRKFDNLLMFFMKVYNVKLLKIFPAIVYMLGSFPDELVNRCTPFQDLKSLTLDFGDFHFENVFGHRHGFWTQEGWEAAISVVKDYLLCKSPDAEYTIFVS